MNNALTTTGPLKRALALAIEAGDIAALRDVAAMASALRKGAQARGMGIEQENVAAEVILRAERALGLILLSVPREAHGPSKGKGGRLPGGEYVRGSTTQGNQTLFDKTVTEIGAGPKAIHQYQTLARLPDENFEGMLASIKGAAERLARVKFISKPDKTGAPLPEERETSAPTEPGWERFRQGAMDMLGWEQGEDGRMSATLNEFERLNADDLRIAAELLTACVAAYQGARAARQ